MFVTAYLCAAAAVCDPYPTKVIVIDGDTIVIRGEHVRVENINAPEIKGKCADEKRLAAMATERLASSLDGSQLVVMRHPTGTQRPDRSGLQDFEPEYEQDRYGRTLAPLIADGQNVGDILLSEGLARKWTKTWNRNEEPWCQGRRSVTGQIDSRKGIGMLLDMAQ
jgi:endonuclease YncB( thermonuclease family)